ncbi:polysaccharide deacetylase family protein [Streptacidiphilus sp. P02-A3a]|nr:polysaccharide deacetylase family protein [Streptacidiphilus sp. P02-A3a]
MNDRVPVLMYHSVHADPAPRTRALSVHPDDFAAQLAVLYDMGFTAVTMATLVRHWRRQALGLEAPRLPDRPVVLTFDDGYADFHRTVLPLLAEHRATASLYVTTGWLADAGSWSAGLPLGESLSWGQLAEAAAEGVEIGGHSHSHPQLDQLPPALLAHELTLNQYLLEQRLQRPLETFGYPFGYSDARVRRAVRGRGYAGACAVANAMAEPRQGPYALSRLTVRRGTGLEDFCALVQGHSLARLYGRDRLLTRGYAVARRGRRMLVRTTAADTPSGTEISQPHHGG